MTKEEAKQYVIKECRPQWENTGWKNIWYDFIDNVILPAIDKKWIEFDDEGNPFELSIYSKEKFGAIRLDIYPYFLVEDRLAENFLELKSEFTCIKCGKQPKNSKGEHIIWTSTTWICPYCKDCAKTIARDDLLTGYNFKYRNDERRNYEYLKNGKKDFDLIFKRRFNKEILKNNKFEQKIFLKDKTETHTYQWNSNDIINEVK